MRQYVDLHMHTDHSDGVTTTADLLALVRERDLVAFSITDHDTISGFTEARTLLRENDPELIPGLELSVSFEEADLHLLTYGFDPEYAPLNEALAEFRARRNIRAVKMVQLLNDMGVNVTLEAIREITGQAAIGRPHIAQAINNVGAVPTYEAAFEKYIGDGKPAYVPKLNFTPADSISVVHLAGGAAILAHPGIGETYQHLEMLVELGLDGIEVYHPAHKQKQIDQFKHLAERYRLVITGGSDYHGRMGCYGDIGSQRVPIDCLTRLKERMQLRKGVS